MYEILTVPIVFPAVTVTGEPVAGLTVAMAVFEELHVPPGVVSVKVDVAPVHNITPVVLAIAGYRTSVTAPLPVVVAVPLISPVVIAMGLT